MTLLDIARLFLFIREAGPNRGLRVEAIQHWCEGEPGDSWCCEFATMVLDLYYQGESPIPRLRAVQDVLDLATKNGWLVEEPQEGDLFIYVNDVGHGHHIGFVSVPHPLTGLAGNTDENGTSSNGDRVAEHYLLIKPEHIKYVRLPQ